MVMRWYKNGSACEYLSKINPNADRLQLVSLCHTFIRACVPDLLILGQGLRRCAGLEYLHTATPAIVHADLKGVR